MIPNDQLDKLRGAKVRVTPTTRDIPAQNGVLRVVDHEIPARGRSLNLEIPQSSGKSIILQLTGAEAKKMIATADNPEREFRWNGKPRTLRPVPAEDMVLEDSEAVSAY